MIMSSTVDADLLMDDRYQSAVDLFNQYDWYSAHDAFEELWYESTGSVRLFLQGIIQIAVGEYHFDNGNVRGATLLMAEGLNHLSDLDSIVLGVKVYPLKTTASRRLSALQSGQSLADIPRPVLEWQTGQ
jgi:uncharacterized protein